AALERGEHRVVLEQTIGGDCAAIRFLPQSAGDADVRRRAGGIDRFECCEITSAAKLGWSGGGCSGGVEHDLGRRDVVRKEGFQLQEGRCLRVDSPGVIDVHRRSFSARESAIVDERDEPENALTIVRNLAAKRCVDVDGYPWSARQRGG